MFGLKQNISFALRTLLKNKGFTITAVLALALGIGATTVIFIDLGIGAQRSRVINMVLKEGAILAICGSAIGRGVAL